MNYAETKLLDGGRLLPVMEEFYTLQGEGYNMGKAAYFVRVGGCDVGCAWCDSKESWNAKLFPPVPVTEVVDRAAATQAKTVVVTGGEPSSYPMDIFTKALREKEITIMVETSGAYPLTGTWDWVCLSPKKNIPPRKENYPLANELKVIIQNKGDLKWAERNAALVSPDCHLFLQPEWSVADQMMETLTEYVMEHPQWRISLQAHKYMRIP
ncbi:MAG: 7-carboxy-7-deazaguanine synthase QueE [Bacteroidales bacterium]|nr:7-carboxy-7-deazaguanine synthase QueE [Bacteroidales bacterium]